LLPSNADPGGSIQLRNLRNLTIVEVAAQSNGDTTFGTTNGLTANTLDLNVDGTITDADSVSILVDGDTTLSGTEITLADQTDDILLLLGDVRIVATTGDVTIAKPGRVELGTIQQVTGENVSINENTAMLLHTVIADQTLTLFSETSIQNLVPVNTTTGLIAPTASLISDGFIHLAETRFDQVSGRAGANASVNADNRLALNTVADATGVKVLDALQDNINPSVNVSPNFISGETLDQVTSDFSFIEHQGGEYGLYLTNQTSLSVSEFVGDGDAINLYMETSDGQDLTIANRIAIQNQTSVDGSITLIAGGDLILNGSLENL